MSEYLEKALEKLNEEYKSGKYDKYAQVMKKDVKETIADFCRQDKEFAQAVAQGGSFGDCMKKVAAGCGSGLSDLEAYRRAVQFYFPGAEIRMQMTIDLIGAARGGPSQSPAATALPDAGRAKGASEGIILDITQFL